jgi:undecaprenyl-diphosphatase
MNPWFTITLLGAPEIWILTTPAVLAAYLLPVKKMDKRGKALFKKFAFVYIASILLTALLVVLLKNTMQTNRPCIPCIPPLTECNPYCLFDNGFPSGHSAMIFAVFTTFWLVLRRKWSYALFFVPLLVASSRYFLGVHRIVDIVAGACIGIVVPILIIKVYEKKPKIRL